MSNPKTRRPKWSRVYILAIIIFVVIITGAGLGFLTASIQTMPDLKGEIKPVASSQVFDVNGKLITTIHLVEDRVPVSLNKVPKNLQNAFIAAEDSRFYQHFGIDIRGIIRAIWSDITSGNVAEGGSTITQQLAKNALLTQERTIKRKIQEAFLALEIERQFTKKEILEMYLNQIYFGQGAYGVETAARIYFGKKVDDLNLAESAMLAGIPKSPNYYSPLNNMSAAKERQAVVLDQMVKYGYISQEVADKTKQVPVKLASSKPQNSNGEASYFIEYITQLLIDKYGANAVYKDGLKIYTTLDIDMQHAAENAMSQLPVYRTDANGIKQPQGALVAVDPHNGYIKAMVGGRGNDQFNRATMAERQPGSAFKPFVYLTAIETGMTPSSMMDDSPVSFGDWTPINYDGKYRGQITLRTALEQSINVVAVKLAQQVTPDKVIYYAQQMGISTLVTSGYTNDCNLAMALGGLTRGVTPLEMASAYGVLANQGIRCEPVAILKIVDRNGKVLDEYQPHQKAVINERSAYILTDMMRGVIARGTGTGANIGRPAAGKTGTTSDYKDAWFVGFTPDLAAAVWMGFDSNDHLPGISGGSIPASIWRKFMSAALSNVAPNDFVRPSGIVPSAPVEENPEPDKPSTTIKSDPQNPEKALPPPPKPVAPTSPMPPEPPTPPEPIKNKNTTRNN